MMRQQQRRTNGSSTTTSCATATPRRRRRRHASKHNDIHHLSIYYAAAVVVTTLSLIVGGTYHPSSIVVQAASSPPPPPPPPPQNREYGNNEYYTDDDSNDDTYARRRQGGRWKEGGRWRDDKGDSRSSSSDRYYDKTQNRSRRQFDDNEDETTDRRMSGDNYSNSNSRQYSSTSASTETNTFPSRNSFAATANDASSSSASSNAIHYNFPTMDASSILQSSSSNHNEYSNNNDDDSESFPPQTSTTSYPNSDHNDNNNNNNNNKYQNIPTYASPRTDILTTYTSQSPLHHLKIHLSTTSIGYLLGSFLGRSILDQSHPTALIIASLFGLMSIVLGKGGNGNVYGECVRCLGFSVILLWGRYWRDVRGLYRTGVHVRSSLGLGRRVPFPPVAIVDDDDDDDDRSRSRRPTATVENPWRYRPINPTTDPEFDMMKALLSTTLLGSFLSASLPIPLLPTYLTGTIGALLFFYVTLTKSPQGDLLRTIGMRMVSLVGEAMEVNGQVGTGRKVGVVCLRVLDRTMILDRKHRIREKVGSMVGRVYGGVKGAVGRVREDRRFQTEEEGEGGMEERQRQRDGDGRRD